MAITFDVTLRGKLMANKATLEEAVQEVLDCTGAYTGLSVLTAGLWKIAPVELPDNGGRRMGFLADGIPSTGDRRDGASDRRQPMGFNLSKGI